MKRKQKNGQALDIQEFVHVVVQMAGIEPARIIRPQDFKSKTEERHVLSTLHRFQFLFYINGFMIFVSIARVGFFVLKHMWLCPISE